MNFAETMPIRARKNARIGIWKTMPRPSTIFTYSENVELTVGR